MPTPTPAPAPAPEPVPPESELTFRTSRASGPGGQHVNKTETRVTAIWSLDDSTAITDVQRERLRTGLAARLDGQGRLSVSCSSARSQLRNKATAIERLRELVAAALVVPKKRKKRRRPRAANEKRLARKRQKAERKANRRPPSY